ncbi:MAG: response regulator, partial [Deltaproteobacteria bacterium]
RTAHCAQRGWRGRVPRGHTLRGGVVNPADPMDRSFLRGLAVLYVEDDGDVRSQLAEFLGRRVGRVILASDGAAALEEFRGSRPDIVVTDIQMPEMDGLSLAHAIRAEDASVPIIVTTAFDQTEYLMRSIDIGVEQYVMKPVDGHRLHATLLACARRLRLEQESARRGALEADALRAKALRLLAGGMAHDYSDLVQVILGNVTLAREMTPHTAPTFEMLVEAEGAAKDAGELGARLRVLSQGFALAAVTGDIESVLRASLGETLSASGVVLRLDLPARCPAVAIDAPALGVVVQHIAANACEAMPSGGTLSVWAEVVEVSGEIGKPLAAGPHVHITFRDGGHGIAPAVLAQVFEPYFSTKERGSVRGMGLGLALARAILQRHRGAISAESVQGDGATFHVWLPVVA